MGTAADPPPADRATLDALLAEAKAYKKQDKFREARKALRQVLADPGYATPYDEDDPGPNARTELALCTYKDTQLPMRERLLEALAILDGDDHRLRTTTHQETLGLAGSIHKRLWETDGRKDHLETALSYYERGYEQGIDKDEHQGYTAINAAYLLDVLADIEEEAHTGPGEHEGAKARRARARQIRQEIVTELEEVERANPDRANWWFVATCAEAYFGLGIYSSAMDWLRRADDLDVPAWERESTSSQLAELARRQHRGMDTLTAFEDSEPGRVLAEFLGDDAAALATAHVGKVGLALSGGGFRASLFHLGVLARLAEMDLLRRVEVLSCVSGGSILGAHYYLKLRNLLQSKPDSDITPQDYVQLVAEMIDEFVSGVQTNVRVRMTAGLGENLKMLRPDYSRTDRIGELYEEKLYSAIDGIEAPIHLNDLIVQPEGEEEGFHPGKHNWRRQAKVPMLVLNATTLNTGHNWQFTATFMGESPHAIEPEVDANFQLRRMGFHEAPVAYRKVRLGRAVGASACVPGLFPPVALPSLYPAQLSENGAAMQVGLVDGGVHDNQGVVGLLEQGCQVVLVSDASGQMQAQDAASLGLLGVPLRSQSIMAARIRGTEFEDLDNRHDARLLRGFMYVHLRKGLEADPVNWIGIEADEEWQPATRGDETEYGVLRDVQNLLAGIRTDLDSFSDVESYALMTSAYRMTTHELAKPNVVPAFGNEQVQSPTWKFLAVEKHMRSGGESTKLKELLKVGAKGMGKAWAMSKPLKRIGAVLGVAIVVALLAGLWLLRDTDVPNLGWIGIGLLVFVAIGAVGFTKWLRGTALKVVIGFPVALLAFLLSRLHLWVFDPIFLRAGKLDKI